jgi:integrase
MAMAALLCGVDLPSLRNQERRTIRRYSLTIKIFGRERVDRSIDAVHAELKRLGYTGYFHREVRNALCEIFLVNQNAELETLTSESLESLRAQHCAHSLKQATFMISHAFVALGIMPSPLRPYATTPQGNRRVETDKISPEWLSWCRRWRETSTLRLATRHSMYYRLLVAGRWLQVTHPDVSRPDQWSRQLAAEYVAAVGQLRAGQFVADRRTKYPDRPLSVSSRLAHISSLRCFFTDLLLWELIPYRFDPKQTFRFPRSLALLRSHNPRIIAEDVWAKLLWAGPNLEHSDLPRSKNSLGGAAGPRYPISMIRAVAIVWLFAGLRKDEIARLRVGCVRHHAAKDEKQPGDGSSVCLLEVPANKTSGNYTKPVHGAVGEAIEEWHRLRPVMRPVVDEKTGEIFHVLFGYRGRPLGNIVLNRSVIPMLCRKAGVPGSDVRGHITSHRARSTIATQLYNAKEPMSLLAQGVAGAPPPRIHAMVCRRFV